MSRAQSLTRGIVSNWAGLGLNIAIGFFLSPFIVNSLGNVLYGIWALAQQFTGYLYLLDFGVREAVVRYTSKYVIRGQAAQLNAVLSTAMVVYLPVVVLCVAVTLLCVWLAPGPFEIPARYLADTRWAVLFTGLTIAQAFVFNVYVGIIQGLRRYDLANGISMAFAVVRLVVIVALLEAGHGLVGLAAATFAISLGNGIANLVLARVLLRQRGVAMRFALPRGRRFQAQSRRVFGYGAYALLHTLGLKIVFTSSTILVGIFQSVALITPFAIADTLAQYLRMLLASTARVFAPAASELASTGRGAELGRLFLLGAKLNVLVALPIALTFVLLGAQFIGVWMGPDFVAPAAQVLAVLGITQIVSAPGNAVISVLHGISRHRVLALLRLGEAAVNIVLSIVLIREYGLIGAALGTAIPHVVLVLLILPPMVAPLVGVSVGSYISAAYVRPLLGAVPFALAAWWASGHVPVHGLLQFFALVGALLCLYLPGVWWLALGRDERARVLAQFRRRAAPAPTPMLPERNPE